MDLSDQAEENKEKNQKQETKETVVLTDRDTTYLGELAKLDLIDMLINLRYIFLHFAGERAVPSGERPNMFVALCKSTYKIKLVYKLPTVNQLLSTYAENSKNHFIRLQ